MPALKVLKEVTERDDLRKYGINAAFPKLVLHAVEVTEQMKANLKRRTVRSLQIFRSGSAVPQHRLSTQVGALVVARQLTISGPGAGIAQAATSPPRNCINTVPCNIVLLVCYVQASNCWVPASLPG